MHPTHVGAATNPLHVVGRSGVDIVAAGKGRKLVIVESPAKAKTIAGYLGGDFDVEASVGHIRDLPNPSELPAEMKKGPFGKFAIDVDNGFEAYYVVDNDKKKKVAELKRLLKDADELYLATDEDREGEAIAWHLLEALKPQGAGQAHGVPRDHPGGDPARRRPTPASSTPPWSTPRRPAASSTASTATRSRPVLWRKVAPGPVRRPRAVRRDPPGRRARTRAHGLPSRRPTGTSTASSRRASSGPDRADAFTARLSAVDGDARRHRPRLRRPRRS